MFLHQIPLFLSDILLQPVNAKVISWGVTGSKAQIKTTDIKKNIVSTIYHIATLPMLKIYSM